MTHAATTQLSPWEMITGDAAVVALVLSVLIAPMIAPGYYR